jgi:L-ascorbate metabolism protein UlaG (beta-lactamase superfamily)
MKITYYGHACVGIEFDGHSLLVDPFISANPLAAAIDIDHIPADFILLTHAHQDHILDVDRIAARTQATIVSNYEIVSHFQAKGFTGHPMNHGGSWAFPFGTLQYVTAIHTSSFPDGSYGGQPGGFVLKTADKCVYIAGDTALTFDMKLIPMRYKLDLAILPIGSNFTMDVADAVVAADFLACNAIMGYHYDTFGYIMIDHAQAVDSFAQAGKKLMLPAIGDSITI